MRHDEQERLLDFVRRTLVRQGGAKVTAESLLFDEGWITSLNILELIGYVEGRLGRRLDDGEVVMPHFRSVRAISEAFFDA